MTRSVQRSRERPFVEKLDRRVVEALTASGLSPKVASAAAGAVVASVEAEFGGQMLYIQKRVSLKSRQRAKEILDRFSRGETQRTLCREYAISFASFYRLTRAVRDARRKLRVQPTVAAGYSSDSEK